MEVFCHLRVLAFHSLLSCSFFLLLQDLLLVLAFYAGFLLFFGPFAGSLGFSQALLLVLAPSQAFRRLSWLNLRFTSLRGNLSASPSALPSGCDRAGGVKFTGGWDEQQTSSGLSCCLHSEWLLTAWIKGSRRLLLLTAAGGTSQELERGALAPEPEHQSCFSPASWYVMLLRSLLHWCTLVYLVHHGVAWWRMVHPGLAGAWVPHQ